MGDLTRIPPEGVRRALDACDDGVYITDRNGRFLYVNAAFLSITGFSRDHVLGERTSIMSSGLMTDAYYRRLWETVLSGRPWREIITNRRANGELYEASQTISPVRDESGEITHMIAVQRDITIQEELDQELRQVQTEVERVASRQKTLLQEVYHRAKNDLELLRSLLELQAAQVDDPQASEALELAAGRAAALGRLYVLYQAHPDAQRVRLPELMERLVAGIRASVLPLGTEVDLDADSAEVPGRLAVAISLTLNELATNAAKHARRPGERLRLSVHASVSDQHVTLVVHDNGPGFPEPLLSSTAEYGFGLGVVSTLARQYDGTLAITNGSGGVATITLLLR